jgi:hypothetical protein
MLGQNNPLFEIGNKSLIYVQFIPRVNQFLSPTKARYLGLLAITS